MTTKQTPMSTVKYLKEQLNFQLREFSALLKEDKEDLREWARVEMEILGIPVKG